MDRQAYPHLTVAHSPGLHANEFGQKKSTRSLCRAGGGGRSAPARRSTRPRNPFNLTRATVALAFDPSTVADCQALIRTKPW